MVTEKQNKGGVCNRKVENEVMKERWWGELITKLLIKDLDKWGQAIGGARCIADDGLTMAVGISIYTNNIGGNVTLARGCDQYFLCPCLYVFPCTISVHKHTCSFYHQVNP